MASSLEGFSSTEPYPTAVTYWRLHFIQLLIQRKAPDTLAQGTNTFFRFVHFRGERAASFAGSGVVSRRVASIVSTSAISFGLWPLHEGENA